MIALAGMLDTLKTLTGPIIDQGIVEAGRSRCALITLQNRLLRFFEVPF